MVENDYNLENGKFETKFLVIEKIGKWLFVIIEKNWKMRSKQSIISNHNVWSCRDFFVSFCLRWNISHFRKSMEEPKLKTLRDSFGQQDHVSRIKQQQRFNLLDFSCFTVLLALPSFSPTSELLTSRLFGGWPGKNSTLTTCVRTLLTHQCTYSKSKCPTPWPLQRVIHVFLLASIQYHLSGSFCDDLIKI